MKIMVYVAALVLSSLVYAQEDIVKDVVVLKSHVESVEHKTLDSNKNSLKPLKNSEKQYSESMVKIARDYFNSIDLNKSEWNGLEATKSLWFGAKQEIVQEISIVVPPLYEMLLFSGSGESYQSKRLLDKTIEKQCQRYARHSSDFSAVMDDYIKVANMTTNKIVATLKNSKVVVVSFKCSLTQE